jgi:GT2 family glycosyltransferase
MVLPMQTNNDLTISIIVHDDFSHIYDALDSLAETTQTAYRVFVVINAGASEDVARLQQAHPQHTYIINTTSQGFASNHNQVMACADTPFIALLNDDVRLHTSALDTMLWYLRDNPSVGLVGPRLLYADGTRQVSVYSDPSLLRMLFKISGLGRLVHQKSRLRRYVVRSGLGRWLRVDSLRQDMVTGSVDVLKGAVMVLRRDVYDGVGGMDETTRAYGEEIDWHLRIRQAGWQVAYVDDAQVTHYGTGQALGELRGWQIVEDRRAILNYFLKHKPRWQCVMVRCAIVAFHGFRCLCTGLFDRSQWRSHFETFKLGLCWTRSRAE